MKSKRLKNLIYKERKLTVNPLVFLTVLFVFMLLIPNYPYYVAFAYTPVAIFFIFLFGRENDDMSFTCCLPVEKKDVVKARFIISIFIELLQVVCAIPFAIISVKINPAGQNYAGIEPNFAFFGLVLMMLGSYNMNYFPKVYKNIKKPGGPLITAMISMFCFIVTVEAIFAYIPSPIKTVMDSVDPKNFPIQLVVLAVGIVLYIIETYVSYKKSVKNFETVDL